MPEHTALYLGHTTVTLQCKGLLHSSSFNVHSRADL